MTEAMKTFLQYVAEDLLRKVEEESISLTKIALVFPNKRAGLFFNEHLAKLAEGHPVWTPDYLTISDFFSSLSKRKSADSIQLVCELYRDYIELSKNEETLDKFYGWGEMILNDFDDIDKNLVDARKIYCNLDDLKEIEDSMEYLSEEQRDIIRQFFHNFKERKTKVKENFQSFWSLLPQLYQRFNKRLAKENIGYEGAIYKEGLQHLSPSELPYAHYAFVGFNVLNKAEHTLFQKINECGKAWFYWDYDTYYLHNTEQEAGWFIKQDLKDFPNELPDNLFHNIDKEKEITYVSAPTENAQARFLPQWIDENLTAEDEKQTAIVLCDESLLQPVLHSIPDKVKEVNVTMGFPLADTPVFSLLNVLTTLQNDGYDEQEDRFHYKEIARVLTHPYIQLLSPRTQDVLDKLVKDNRFFPLRSELTACGDPVLEQVFAVPSPQLDKRIAYLSEILQKVASTYKTEEHKDLMAGQLYRESLFNAYTTLERFHRLLEQGILAIKSPQTLTRLLTRVLSGISIPFHGEPAKGLQIMGVLETRNLDFRRVIMLSVNEGKLPKGVGENSLIPYNLRMAYGMTTIRHQVSVYAYYFYRLLQRAEKATLMYNKGNAGTTVGEMSRFMLQYKMESGRKIKELSLNPAISPVISRPVEIEKTKEMLLELAGKYKEKERFLSPTALNTYLNCPLKFYFTFVAGFRETDEISSVIDPRYFGNIFHKAAENLYRPYMNNLISKDLMKRIASPRNLKQLVEEAFRTEFFHLPQGTIPAYNGEQYIKKELVEQYLKQLVQYDLRHAPFTILGLEETCAKPISVSSLDENEIREVYIGGLIDRRDLTLVENEGECVRIVDYKTGGKPSEIKDMDSLFMPSPQRAEKEFQTFLYAWLAHDKAQGRKHVPALFFVHKSYNPDFQPELVISQKAEGKRGTEKKLVFYEDYAAEFEDRLRGLLNEIFNPAVPFTQTEDQKRCGYCAFAGICKRL